MNPSRAELRQFYKRRRADLDPQTRRAAIQSIVRHLSAAPQLQAEQTIAAFLATDTEVELTDWMRGQWARGGRIALPRVADAGAMTFHAYTATTTLAPNRYGIAEPVSSPLVDPVEIDAVLVPLVAFDRRGTRLGMGGGYYDRFLPQLRSNVPAIGVAFACQESDAPLPRNRWDVPLDAVVTENGVLELGSA